MEQIKLDALKESLRYHISNCDELGDFVSTYIADAKSFIEQEAIVWEPFEELDTDGIIDQIEALKDQFVSFAKRSAIPASTKLNTVNVIALDGGIVTSMISYTDHNAGNCDAEAEFIRYIKENISADMNGMSEDEILDDGYFDYGDKSVFIAHSTN